MAGLYNPPVKGQDFVFQVSLTDMATSLPGSFLSSPTITSNSFQVSVGGATFSTLATLPVVTPAASIGVLVSLSSAEMNADYVMLKAISTASPKAWADFALSILTVSSLTT